MKFKQLEWEAEEGSGDLVAQSVCGIINIWANSAIDDKTAYDVIFEVDATEDSFTDLESAKAFAQSHHEELLKQAIDMFVETNKEGLF